MADYEKWTKVYKPMWESTNFILKKDDFWISYNPNPGNTVMGSSWEGDGGQDETALCDDAGNVFILNGDFRSSYENIIDQGFDACKKFFDQQAAHAKSSWSDS